MHPEPGHLPRVVHADQESPRDRAARAFAAECAAAALEVFERQRRRTPRRGAAAAAPGCARAEGGSKAAGTLLSLLVALSPSERG